ncbi:MAG: cell filamentation protein [Clostridiales bacterium]|nr:cell filamentation protein [Clostridiales bacterium]
MEYLDGYDYGFDKKYCYPKTSVLRNKLNIKKEEFLLEAERNITAVRILQLKQNPPFGSLDLSYFLKLHQHIFGDIYSWAGKIRVVDIAKGSLFCKSEFIMENLEIVFHQIEQERYLTETSEQDMPHRLSYFLSEINAIHPFREGNGRVQRAYIEILAKRAGYEVDFSDVTKERMVAASIASFFKEYEQMDEIFKGITKPILPRV